VTKQPADRNVRAIGDQLKQPGSPAHPPARSPTQGEHEVRPYASSPAHPLTRSPARWLASALFLLFLAIYVRTAAPSVLSGDSAEFQLAAPLLGVPHPTTYPLYVLLGKLATLLVPFGDLAWRVTLVSAICAALAVALFFLLARRVTGSAGAAAVAALALGVAPGLWNAATLAEVYALLAALLAGLGYLLVSATDHRPPTTDHRPPEAEDRGSRIEDPRSSILDPRSSILDPQAPSPAHPLTRSPAHPLTRSPAWQLRTAAFVAGLGCTHHGLFVLTGLPLFVGYVLWRLAWPRTTDHRPPTTDLSVNTLRQLAILMLCFAAGLVPWLYTLVQYARYGPFDGSDYGLPQHYFWGAPRSWGQVFDLIGGGALRRGIFRLPSLDAALATLRLVWARLWFEFGPLGVALGALGSVVLARRARGVWAGTAWVFLVTLAYLLLLGPAVIDAPVFTLPMLLPWALWIAAAVALLLRWANREPRTAEPQNRRTKNREPQNNEQRTTNNEQRTTDRVVPSSLHPFALSLAHPLTHSPAQLLALTLLIAATLAWGYTRVPYSSKRRLLLFREFGQATLAVLPPRAAVITHWEQGMTLQYLRLVEGQRPDVWVDVVEPADEDWGARARRRYADRPVFFVGGPADVAGLPVELLREAEYADLFRLRVE
jgi:Protein O-mannosyl-transferase TMEM260-like